MAVAVGWAGLHHLLEALSATDDHASGGSGAHRTPTQMMSSPSRWSRTRRCDSGPFRRISALASMAAITIRQIVRRQA